jgi:hypothetical protein
LVARQWLTQDEGLKKQIVDLAVNESMPSPFTTMVAYETKQKEGESKEQEKKKQKGNSKAIAAAAVGGVLILSAAAVMSFGDLAGTAAGFGNLIGDAASCCGSCDICGLFECCGGCGGCDICSIFSSCDCGGCADCICWMGSKQHRRSHLLHSGGPS